MRTARKILENKQRNEERKARTRRLIERGAILEGIFPLALEPSRRRGQGVPDCPVPSSGGGGTGRKTAEIRGQAVNPLFTRVHLYTVAGVVRPAGGAVALSERDGALHSPNPLCAPRSQTPASRLSGSTEPEYPLTERRCHP